MKKSLLLIFISIFSFATIHADITWTLSDDGTLSISGNNMPNYDCYEPRFAPWYSQRDKIKKVVIENGVTNISQYAFFSCNQITSITIPNSVINIGNSAFNGCSSLTSITIPNSVTSIGKLAFYSTPRLSSIKVEDGNIYYDSRNNCNAIIETQSNTLLKGCKNTIIPNTVTSIELSAFSECVDLKSITIPNSVTNIGNSAFYGCSRLTSITIPNSVVNIGIAVFSECSRLTTITLSNSITSIGQSTFYKCSALTSVIIPKSVTSIGQYAFYGCSSLTSINIPNSVTSIGTSAFAFCEGLTSITIPESVTNIGGTAFLWCSGLTSITIPESVTSIGTEAFKSCRGLTSITCKANTPPYCERECFNDVKKSIPVYVPANSINAYKDANEWEDFTNIQAIIDNQSIANAVITKIDAIGKVEYSDACKDKIDDANNAYDALTDEQKALVTNLDVLTTAQQTYDNLKAAAEKLAADKAKADAVIVKINAIGKVEYTNACKGKIDAASKAYEALTDDQKALVTNIDVLTTAKQTYDNLKAAADKLAADKAKADAVIAKINAIGKVEYTYACKDKIDDANNAYNALTADQKALVSNLDVLTTAKQTYDNLKTAAEKLAADKAKAEPVIAKINAIGKVEYTDACKNKIDEANNAYNALTADQKALVSNLDVLTTAQQTYESLKAAAEKLAADKAAFDQYKSEQKAIIEALIKEDDSDAVKDIIKKAISDIDALGYEEAISLDDNKVNINSFVTSVNETVEKQRAEDQKTTRIEELELAEKANIFDLNGRKITNSMLKSGLYIRNGKKVVVK